MHCQLDRRRALRGWRPGPHPHVEHIPRPPCAHEVLAHVPLQTAVSALQRQKACGTDAGIRYEEFESMCEAHVTRPQPHTVGLKQSAMPPAQPKKNKRGPAHLIPFRRRNAPRPPMKNRKIPKSKIGRWRSELSALSRYAMTNDTSVWVTKPSASSITRLESRNLKSSSERLSEALKNLVDLANIFDGEIAQQIFDCCKEQMDKMDSLRLEFKATTDADLWTGLAMIDGLEDCLEDSIKASIKASAKKFTTKMLDLLEAQKLSKINSVAPPTEPAPL
ncbi:hypothetical protein PILCRDRAFT_826857 [Piloderma croceum F 1598]|uniref:Uncharacterized protein n=1 Tax=Piloderma croceum (strain F 1598) TaxID=765440 RepID=A0A0C3AQ01_PILCF|nr:hypothetical protein PILCRDRAFT_826857 [Piloderma croceum F 1598]